MPSPSCITESDRQALIEIPFTRMVQAPHLSCSPERPVHARIVGPGIIGLAPFVDAPTLHKSVDSKRNDARLS